ncbi:hypothetical protein FACS1894196_3630 [Clostridia bacterium]|nr:hypothetical protein FACS1894196_3630 [Clostridia bacterium]
MEVFTGVIALAVVIQGIVEVAKGVVPSDAVLPAFVWPLVCAVLGIALCVATETNALTDIGVVAAPWIGQAITGLLISRGSNFFNDIWKQIRGGNAAEE